MVSFRCKLVVKAELDALGIEYCSVELGRVELKEDLTPQQHGQLKEALRHSGLELMDDKKAILIEKIKTAVIELVYLSDEPLLIKNSNYISDKLNHNYTYLANLFAEVTGITIEYFIIAHKIERVKEMLLYDELNLTQISYKLNYSSVAHLSNQFKKVTGLTPSFYKKLKVKKRGQVLTNE